MRRLGILAAVCALATVLVGGVTSAGTASLLTSTESTAAPVHKLDLSSVPKIRHYLRSIGIDPKTVVIQRGHRNYAGPRCPGRRWNCTRARRVVQIATDTGQNQFTCTPSNTGTADATSTTCVIVQPSGGNNQAQCYERTAVNGAVELCVITQTGDQNVASVHQEIDQSDGVNQTAAQFANVTQQATGKNDSEIYQAVNQSETTGSSQDQEAHQAVQVTQAVAGSENFSHVHQTQSQRETGSALSQSQNTDTTTTGATAGDNKFYPFNCGVEKPASPNQCASVCQTTITAITTTTPPSCVGAPVTPVDNESHLHQFMAETESTDNTAVTSQTQGDPLAPPKNGQGGHIHQENPFGAGINHDHDVQSLGQREVAPGTTTIAPPRQHQHTDPGCCGISQIGGSDDLEDINQAVDQSATDSNADQDSLSFGHVHDVTTPPELATTTTAPTSGNEVCSIDQHARVNSDGTNNSVNGQGADCSDLFLQTTCTNTATDLGPAGCTATETPECLDCPPPDVPIVVTALLPTFGQDITMPSFDEPASYVPFGG